MNHGDRAGAAPRVRPEIAVVIPTFGRPELLGRCLRALLRQSVQSECFEIVVVDDRRDDATRALVASMAAGSCGAPALRYLRPRRGHGPAAARNAGWRASGAALIAFTDEDMVPDVDWLREGRGALAQGAAAASGRTMVAIAEPATDDARMRKRLEHAEFVSANAFVQRDAMEALGGFDERFTRARREDCDLHFALIDRYGEPARVPSAVVVHPAQPARWGISMWQQRSLCLDGLLYKKHPRLYLERIRCEPPWGDLLVVCASAAAVVAGVGGASGSAWLLAGAAAAGVAVRAAQRLRGTSHRPAHVAEMLITSIVNPFLSVFWRAVGISKFRVIYP